MKIQYVDAFQWSADAPDDPAARRSAALDDGEVSSSLTDEGRTALE